MYRLATTAQARLSPEACTVAELFLAALPPYVRRHLHAVRLFGPQARRFEPDAAFDVLVVADERTTEMKSAAAIAASAVQADGVYSALVTVVTAAEYDQPAAKLPRLLQNARREGVDLWVAAPARAPTP